MERQFFASSKQTKKYRSLPLFFLGLVIFAGSIIIFGLLWGLISFRSQAPVEQATAVPLLIFLLAIFLASLIVSLINKGQNLAPSVSLALFVWIFSWVISEGGHFSFGGFLLKLICALLAAVLPCFVARFFSKKSDRQQARNYLSPAARGPKIPQPRGSKKRLVNLDERESPTSLGQALNSIQSRLSPLKNDMDDDD
ncbi:MAG: hypothetical protein FWF85_08995 [Clostridiales bacterium]|nr:hypothetical protein [Clostridiales bacterium]MDR2713443.1 hypothetical protein [Clostridiales bacterium]